jgi:RNA polymerase sigma-70 factor (ECF subfamily)
MGEPSDEALVARVAVGDSMALEHLIRRYRKRVYGVLMRGVGRSADADDLFQETWIRVARRASTFDPARKFAPWVATIATNLAIDWLRGNAKLVFDDAAGHLERNTSIPDPAQTMSAAQAQHNVTRALASLPEHMRQAILLRYFDELTEEEMATNLGIPKGTVKSRLHNALKSLRMGLGDHDDVA